MRPATRRFAAVALLSPAAITLSFAQMHRVATPDQVTRAVGVYEYVGDVQHPKAARLIPVSLFIGGHFEDADVYLARPIPFALDGGLRYELQHAGVRDNFLDVVASRHFTNSASTAPELFDNSWFGYGRVSPLPAPKAAKLRPNCGNAHVVQETDTAKKDDGKPHFGSKPAADEGRQQPTRGRRNAAPDLCRDEDDEKPEPVTLADDRKKDDAPDPERPTLHRSPATTANNTGAEGKPDKKAPKPPPATVTANGGPADDPDRPTIRHRTSDEDDPNALPPDPVDLASRKLSPATGEAGSSTVKITPSSANDTVAEGGTISAGDTSSGAPVLRRGRLTAPAPAAPPASASIAKASAPTGKAITIPTGVSVPASLDAVVAVSDAKERAPHDFSYHFTSSTERTAALSSLQAMALAVVSNPALATDAAESGTTRVTPPAPLAAAAAPQRRAAGSPSRAGTRSTRVPAHVSTAAQGVAAPTPADEEMAAFQLYFSAPITYSYTARIPGTASTPERFVTVVAQTNAEGKLEPAMRSVTDAAHLDRTPRYRLIDVVDADGSNRASLLMELRAQHTRQFALYRLLGNKPDQIFLSGTTLL